MNDRDIPITGDKFHSGYSICYGSLDSMLEHKAKFSGEIIVCKDDYKLYIYPEKDSTVFRAFKEKELADAFVNIGFKLHGPGTGLSLASNKSVGRDLNISIYSEKMKYPDRELVSNEGCLYISDGKTLRFLVDPKDYQEDNFGVQNAEGFDTDHNKLVWEAINDIHAVTSTCDSLPMALTLTACYLFTISEVDSPRAKIIREALMHKEEYGLVAKCPKTF